MHLATQALSLAKLQACHSNKRNIVKSLNWQEADQLVINKAI